MVQVSQLRRAVGAASFAVQAPGEPGIVEISQRADEIEVRGPGKSLSVAYQLATPASSTWSAAVPSRTLSRVVGRLEDGDVELGHDSQALKIRSGSVSARVREVDFTRSRFLSLEPDAKTIGSLAVAEVGRIARVAAAASPDSSRGRLTGVHLKPGLAEATDTFWLARTRLDDWDSDVLIPAGLIERIYDEVRTDTSGGRLAVSTDGRSIAIETDAVYWCSNLIDGPYPLLDQYFSVDRSDRLRADRDAFNSAVRTAAVISNGSLALRCDGRALTISSLEIDEGEVEVEIEAEHESQTEMNFSTKLLRRALEVAKPGQLDIYTTTEGYAILDDSEVEQLIMLRSM